MHGEEKEVALRIPVQGVTACGGLNRKSPRYSQEVAMGERRRGRGMEKGRIKGERGRTKRGELRREGGEVKEREAAGRSSLL
jgi:hypothetical protein